MNSRISHELPIVAAIAAAFAILLSIFWVGFIASDDAIYLAHARAWASDLDQLPSSHWGFRYTIIIPLALALEVLGDVQLVENGVAVILGIVLICAVYLVTRKIVSRTAAAAVAGIMATTPIIVISASILNVDLLEIMFGICSIGLFTLATQRELPAKYLIFSGIFLGLAFQTRETASGLILAYGLFFLFGAFLERKRYLWGALGFLIIFGTETFYYVSMGESPLLRFATAAQTHGTIDLSFDKSSSTLGNISSDRIFGPLLALLVNQEFGLLFFLVVPASWMLLRDESLPALTRTFVQVLVSVIVVWIFWTSYNGALLPLPRYYIFATGLAVILIGLWLNNMSNKRIAITVACLTILTNFAALSLENTHPRFASKTLVEFLESNEEPVYTDLRTYGRAATFQFRSSDDAQSRLRTTPPPSGSLYFFNPNITAIDRSADDLKAAAWDPANSEVVQVWSPPKRFVGKVLTALNLDGYLPSSIRSRVVYCGDPPQLVRYDP